MIHHISALLLLLLPHGQRAAQALLGPVHADWMQPPVLAAATTRAAPIVVPGTVGNNPASKTSARASSAGVRR